MKNSQQRSKRNANFKENHTSNHLRHQCNSICRRYRAKSHFVPVDRWSCFCANTQNVSQRGGTMLAEIINLDGDQTVVFMEAYRDGVRNARKLMGGDDE